MDGLLNNGAEALLQGLLASLRWRFPSKSHTGIVLFGVAPVTPDLFSLYFHGEVLQDEHLVEVRLRAWDLLLAVSGGRPSLSNRFTRIVFFLVFCRALESKVVFIHEVRKGEGTLCLTLC